MSLRTFAGCALFSVLAHAAVGLSFDTFSTQNDAPSDRSVTISYLSLPPEPVARVQPAPVLPAPLPKAAPKAAAAKAKPGTAALPAAGRADVSKFTSAFPAPRPQRSWIRDSAEILRDPKDGKIFTSYFGTVKEKIYQVIRRKYPQQNVSQGSVTLVFVLDRTGRLENVWVADKQTAADEAARDFAMLCLKAAAPFPPFPRELDLQKITFNVSVLFEDL